MSVIQVQDVVQSCYTCIHKGRDHGYRVTVSRGSRRAGVAESLSGWAVESGVSDREHHGKKKCRTLVEQQVGAWQSRGYCYKPKGADILDNCNGG